ncbi:MAG: 30S ribosomal protein S21 [bacterium]
MVGIKVYDNESLDNALRRFKRKCLEEGIIAHLFLRASTLFFFLLTEGLS